MLRRITLVCQWVNGRFGNYLPTGIVAIGGLLPSPRDDISAGQMRFQIHIRRLTRKPADSPTNREADLKQAQAATKYFLRVVIAACSLAAEACPCPVIVSGSAFIFFSAVESMPSLSTGMFPPIRRPGVCGKLPASAEPRRRNVENALISRDKTNRHPVGPSLATDARCQ